MIHLSNAIKTIQLKVICISHIQIACIKVNKDAQTILQHQHQLKTLEFSRGGGGGGGNPHSLREGY